VIGEEFPAVVAAQKKYRPRCPANGPCCSSAAAARTTTRNCSSELGMETIAAGYEFAHRDDYEGREVLPTIKVDADSRNIEELHVEADPDKYRAYGSERGIQREKQGYRFSEYDGMMAEMRTRR
jgi:nitrogenase molybdenum-iron protein alpha chain